MGYIIEGNEKMFCWYHVKLPIGNQKHSQHAQYLIDVICPPLKLQDILSLVSNGPYCAHIDGALFFRVKSPGPHFSKFTFRLAAMITKNSVITVSLGECLLGFSPVIHSLLNEIPIVESLNFKFDRDETTDRGSIVIQEHVLDFLLTMDHSEEADNHVPRFVSNLVVHIIDMHVNHLEDVVTKLDIQKAIGERSFDIS
nr:Mg2+ transporter protein, CorA-like/zinc transport protein ZntB [Tanacetum cinerariifolium]GEZ87245.1 Mg2+ transporter protein, CorA-like/zinc transport protein ZntB [Tanacetum cinerariifolium]